MTMTSQQYALLADHSYGRDEHGNAVDLSALVGKSTVIGGVEYEVLAFSDKPSGYQGAIYQRTDSGEIVVAHRGTEFDRQKGADLFKADGLMVFSRFNPQADDAIALSEEAVKIAEVLRKKGREVPPITHTGHSLGGTLAQISGHYFGHKGETFNAYGAASLTVRNPSTDQYYRIRAGGNGFVNHVMGADLVSAGSSHYGQERRYTHPREINTLAAYGYENNKRFDLRFEGAAVAAMRGGSHDMHNFLPWNGKNRPDVSILSDPAARQLAQQYDPMLDKFRGDVKTLRQAAGLLGTNTLDVIEAFQRPLEAGEPARRARLEQGRSGAVLQEPGSPPGMRDMRDPSHPAHDRYRQAYAGVEAIDRSLARAPDGRSERLAASLAAASSGLPTIAKVSLSEDGRYAFAFGEVRDGSLRGMARVETSTAVQTSVEESSKFWLQADVAQPSVENPIRQHAQRHTQQQAIAQSGPVLG